MGDITYLVKAVMLYSKTCTHIVDSDKPMLEQKDNLGMIRYIRRTVTTDFIKFNLHAIL